MVQAIVIEKETAVKATVIAQRTGSNEIGIASAMTNGRGYSKELVNCIAYYDVVKGSWRSFRFESLIKVF